MRRWTPLVLAGGWWTFVCLAPAPTPAADASADKKAAAEPWSDLTPVAPDAPFGNVRSPHLNAQGEMTFIADDQASSPSKAGPRHGIYRCRGERLVCLVRAGETTVPGTAATLKILRGLQTDETGGDFLFLGVDSEEKRGLYRWSQGQLATVARAGATLLPGEREPLRSVENGAWNGTHILYQATAADRSTVLVLHDLTTDGDRIVCRTGMDIPGHGDAKFRFIAAQNWLSADSILFRAASTDNPSKADAAGTIGLYGWFGIKDWTGAGGDLAPGKLRTVVDGNTTVPIPEVPGTATFDNIGSAPVDGDATVFQGRGRRFQGIFISKTPGGPVQCVVSNHTKFDGPFKGVFTGFGGDPTVVGQNVVFTADAQENDDTDDDGADDANAGRETVTYHGVFVYRLDRGELYALTDSRFPPGGKEIVGMEIANHLLVRDRFAVAVRFKDKSSQIFRGTIRPEAFRRLTGAGPAATPVPADPAR